MSSDESPAVVELPDDADDAASSTDEVGAVARVLFDLFEGPPTGGPVAFHRLRAREVLATVEPLIAARVHAEALAGADERIAEAVAAERQRIADAILPDHWQTVEMWGGVQRLACGRCRHGDGVRFLWPCPTRRAITGEPEPELNSAPLVAGYVPVATPEPTARDERPHSRACGLRQHEHGSACAVDCPTCTAGGGWHYPVAISPTDPQAVRPNRDARYRTGG